MVCINTKRKKNTKKKMPNSPVSFSFSLKRILPSPLTNGDLFTGVCTHIHTGRHRYYVLICENTVLFGDVKAGNCGFGRTSGGLATRLRQKKDGSLESCVQRMQGQWLDSGNAACPSVEKPRPNLISSTPSNPFYLCCNHFHSWRKYVSKKKKKCYPCWLLRREAVVLSKYRIA